MNRAFLATLLAGLLWGPPSHAQDPPKKAEEPEAPARAKKSAEIMRWCLVLGDADETKRKQARERLVEILGNEDVVEVLARFVPAGGRVFVGGPGGHHVGMLVQYDPSGPSEMIRGSWEGDGETVNYTLEKGAGTRYELRVERKRGKQVERSTDSGTLAQLRKRHAFLKGALSMTLPRLAVSVNNRIIPRAGTPLRSKALGAIVERPSADLAHHFFLPKGVGFIVRHVEKGSRAERLGLKPFDVLVKIEGRFVEEVDQLAARQGVLEYLRRARPGRKNLKLE